MEEHEFSEDSAWKEQANQEKEKLSEISKHEEESGHEHGDMEVNFFNYILSLGFQAMVFLGEVVNPVTERQEKNLPQAKMLIDTLRMLREKTKGNLDPHEDNIINSSIYELEMKYVELAKTEKKIVDG